MLSFLDIRKHSKMFISLLMFFHLTALTNSYDNSSIHVPEHPLNVRICALLTVENVFHQFASENSGIFSSLSIKREDILIGNKINTIIESSKQSDWFD